MIRKHAVSLVGLLIMAVAFLWNVLWVDESVPNDANIGAGILFLVGNFTLIVGLAITWARRSTPPPPAPGDSPVTC